MGGERLRTRVNFGVSVLKPAFSRSPSYYRCSQHPCLSEPIIWILTFLDAGAVNWGWHIPELPTFPVHTAPARVTFGPPPPEAMLPYSILKNICRAIVHNRVFRRIPWRILSGAYVYIRRYDGTENVEVVGDETQTQSVTRTVSNITWVVCKGPPPESGCAHGLYKLKLAR